jgi:hypothetical protein
LHRLNVAVKMFFAERALEVLSANIRMGMHDPK